MSCAPGYQAQREEFIGRMVREGMDVETARLVLRDAATVQRWAEAECNGEIQRDDNGENPERVYGHSIRSVWHETRFKVPDRDAQAQARIRKRMPRGFAAVFQGDPRGACVKILTPSGDGDSWETLARCGRGHVTRHAIPGKEMCHEKMNGDGKTCRSPLRAVRPVCVPTRSR